MTGVDATDWKIIDILRDEYVSNSAIAAALNVSEGMIRQRIKKLKDSGILKLRAQINPDALHGQQLALIAVNLAAQDTMEQKAHEISALDNVLSVSIASGRYDLFVEVLVDSNRGLVRFLIEELPKVKGIISTESFLMLKNFNRFV